MQSQDKLPFPKCSFFIVASIMLVFILMLTFRGNSIQRTAPEFVGINIDVRTQSPHSIFKPEFVTFNTDVRTRPPGTITANTATKTSKEITKHVSKTRNCSLLYLQNYLAEKGRFFGEGQWVKGQWEPRSCQVPERVNAERLAQCLTAKKIEKIGILGDSQSMRYAAMIRTGEGAFQCKKTKAENGGNRSPSINFFSPPIAANDLRATTRDCLGCAGLQATCTFGSSKNSVIKIENMITENVKDSELITRRSSVYKNCDDRLTNKTGIPCLESSTTQEVIFQEYWCLDGYPDVIIVFATHVHEAVKRNARNFERDFTWFVDLITTVVPKTTKILYVNAPKVTPPQPEAWKTEGRNIFIDELNKIAAAVIHRSIVERKVPNLYPMYDMFSMSVDRNDWNGDGVHFKPQWYKHAASLLWTTLCMD
ncbi:uncharacterized protein LOC106151471 [Lingula anatina]|uniref:Uncharacterized protein LOC106151471 n=1 Tax=Lingula anatina TaxID=7574 RepID=A0A1S3H2F7_LINAN|nr:uncharacterized protein LOC106151471 [Lingula anatina]XP_013380207.1 uncharacterized protein LOC106151471 [Lingula anatina]|eukprot:XP_013380198.1 uncharacterized protein LOC106151471 [Lingula anatina]